MFKKNYLGTCFFVILTNILIAQQKQNYQWIIGYGTIGENTKDGTLLDFRQDSVQITYFSKKMFINGTNTSICDTAGSLLLYSNGCIIANRNNEILINGDALSPGYLGRDYCPYIGSPLPQGAIILPRPHTPNQYYLFNSDLDYVEYPDTSMSISSTLTTLRVYYHLIDMNEKPGTIVEKYQIAVMDTMPTEYLQAVRHANGEDWWLLKPESLSNCQYIFLITKEGVQPPIKQCVGKVWSKRDWTGQAVFSPDGRKYVRFNPYNGLNIFDFDRCNGQLSNPVHIAFDSIDVGGAAISTNSRYLYVTTSWRIYQFDLQAMDITFSKTLVAEYDGFVSVSPTNFYIAQLAPDNKIYISSTSSTDFLHVIIKPNERGINCNVVQHGIKLAFLSLYGLPNLPHYRLGKSTEPCVTATEEIEEQKQKIQIYPNPTSGTITITLPTKYPSTLHIFNALGEMVKKIAINQSITLNVADLPSGLYVCSWQDENGTIVSEKLVVQK